MKTILTALLNLLSSLNPAVTAVMAAVTVFSALFSYFNSMWSDLFARVDALASSSFGSADFSPLGFVNYVFPLDTLCTFLGTYMALRLACAAIRIVKSFVPTISS